MGANAHLFRNMRRHHHGGAGRLNSRPLGTWVGFTASDVGAPIHAATYTTSMAAASALTGHRCLHGCDRGLYRRISDTPLYWVVLMGAAGWSGSAVSIEKMSIGRLSRQLLAYAGLVAVVARGYLPRSIPARACAGVFITAELWLE